MIKLLTRVFAVFGFLVVAGGAIGGYIAYQSLFASAPLPKSIVLTLDLDGPLQERSPDDGLPGGLLGETGRSLREAVDALDRAGRDRRVKGVLVRLGSDDLGLGQIQELRAALARFRTAGKFSVAFAESFGEFGPGTKSYYLATACDQIWLQPVGMLGLTGFSVEMPFFRGLLDRLRIVPEVKHRQEYKSATEGLTERAMSGPHREMMESLLDDWGDQVVGEIAASRRVDVVELRRLIDKGPLTDDETRGSGLVDRLGYYDEVAEEVLKQADVGRQAGDSSLVGAGSYLAAAGSPNGHGPTVALIHVVGDIQRGESSGGQMLGSESAGSETIVSAFQEAIDDDDCKAVLLRINSPGGSVVASESIRRAVVQARDTGMPVIVSMSDMAASGGYWIAMNANRIIAEPGTLTGSIGVIVGKIATGGFWDLLGVAWDGVKRGEHAGIWSAISSYSPGENARVDAVLDHIYDSFIENVAEARQLPEAQVREIARGRVWTGRQALKLGLVDELGDMELALRRVREALKLKPDAPIRLEVYPQPESPLERLVDILSSLGVRVRAAAGVVDAVTAAVPLARNDGMVRLRAPGMPSH